MIITGKKFSKPDLSRVINGDTELPADAKTPEKFRLDHLLVEQHPEYNRSTLQSFIRQGFVTVSEPSSDPSNSATSTPQILTKPNAGVLKDAVIELRLPETTKPLTKPPVIYEDTHVLVLNKPAGLLSMAKGEYCPEPTLEDFGLLVHRLDRDTSGVVILAKDPETQKLLRKQFQDRKAHKTYYAIVEGRPKLDTALIDLPIARNLKHPTTFQVDQNGKPSQTFYKVLRSGPAKNSAPNSHSDAPIYSLLELQPKTGRTHQLRVHLKYLGTPILGDPVYGAKTSADRTDRHPRHRLYLHAHSLEITIPGPAGNQRKTFTADLPPEFDYVF